MQPPHRNHISGAVIRSMDCGTRGPIRKWQSGPCLSTVAVLCPPRVHRKAAAAATTREASVSRPTGRRRNANDFLSSSERAAAAVVGWLVACGRRPWLHGAAIDRYKIDDKDEQPNDNRLTPIIGASRPEPIVTHRARCRQLSQPTMSWFRRRNSTYNWHLQARINVTQQQQRNAAARRPCRGVRLCLADRKTLCVRRAAGGRGPALLSVGLIAERRTGGRGAARWDGCEGRARRPAPLPVPPRLLLPTTRTNI